MAASADHPPIVLVVEDHDDTREMYCRSLEAAGYWALGAADAADGLKAVREYRPDVVVTDIGLPGMDGWQFARAVRGETHAHRVGIIAVSGWAIDPAVEDEARRLRVHAVMTKPCLPEELIVQIRRLLARGRLARVRGGSRLARAHHVRTADDLSERSAKSRKPRAR